PASQIVQRKIGMEYQTVGGKNNVFVKTLFTVKAHAGHGTFLFRSNNIEVTADGPDLEYVTPAVNTPEEALEAGRAAAGIHQQLMAYKDANLGVPGLYSMKAKNVEEKVDAFVYDKYKEVNQDAEQRSWMYLTGGTFYMLMNLGNSAHPQATVGIRMNKIADLLLYLGGRRAGAENKDLTGTVPLGITTARLMEAKGKTEAQKDSERMELLAKQKQTMRNAPRKAMDAIIDYVSQHPEAKFTDWDSVWGLISLLFAYHAQFLMILNHPSAAMIAKDAMPVMNRTSLYDAYRKLARNDRKIFLAVMRREIHIKHPERWSKTTFTYQDPSSKKPMDVDEIVLAGKFEGMEGDSEVWDFLKLDEWVNALAVGVDAMYNRFHSIGSIANRDAGNPKAGLAKFELGESTDIGLGNDAPGLLVELRGLERGVPSERWGEIAWRVAYLIRCLNDGKVPDASKVPDFSKEQ
ncbi:MAG: hypothetical protein J1F18_15385, partial [Lachnospiraceae bacterium]|nr:hypothetical protein [Lachnospiraceae bacterium]